MRASAITRTTIIRISACALVALGLLGASAAASSAAKVRTKGIVIATFGKNGVEVVGVDHQARMITLHRRAKSIRPGSIVRYRKAKAAGGKSASTKGKVKPIPVEIVNHIKVLIVNHVEHVGRARGTSVFGVVTKRDSVRLADGNRIGGETVKDAVAALQPGAPVTVSLRFSQGRTQVRNVRPKQAPRPPKKKPVVPPPAPAPPPPAPSGPWWTPSSASALPLHWILDGTVSVGDAASMGGSALPLTAVYDLDGERTSKATVDALHALGTKVICYVNAGTYESYRSDSAALAALSPPIYGNGVQGWAGEYWLDIRRIDDLAPFMQARFQNCKDKGFDAIEPDNIDGWSNNTGFPIAGADQIAYNKALAQWAHGMGMSIGLKNDLEQIPSLVGDFDWALNEECYDYNECSSLKAFTQAGKAVWIAQYKSLSSSQCADSLANRFNTAQYELSLTSSGGRTPCPGTW